MVSVGVSALGRTDLYFVDADVKINGQYYREVLLMQKLLPDIKEFSDYFTFQQDSAPAHRAKETVDLLKRETPDFIPPSLAFKQGRIHRGGGRDDCPPSREFPRIFRTPSVNFCVKFCLCALQYVDLMSWRPLRARLVTLCVVVCNQSINQSINRL